MILRPNTPPRRATQDRAIVPMINVVFLLLIFFLMSASLAPPEPLEITPPVAPGANVDRQGGTLFIDATGTMAYSGHTGEAIWPALSDHTGPLPASVDAAYPASDLAALLQRLGQAGITDVRLLTVRP